MKILFVHHNFPAQFRNLAAALSRTENVEVAAIGCEFARSMFGVSLYRYPTPPGMARAHSFARRFDNECRRAEEVLYAATKLAADGFTPDAIFVHPGWGESLPLKTVFPTSKIVVYCEYYYRGEGGDIGFDPEFPGMGVDGYVGLEARNATTLLALASADAGISPTHWQKSTYPGDFHSRISVIHEGVDTALFAPDRQATFQLADGSSLSAKDEIVTYSARNLEPIRGFHSFLRAAPLVLEKRPDAKILIVGDEGVSYGAPPRKHPTWKAAMLDELGDRIDPQRVRFLGRLPYSDYLKILQISTAHVYLTYPFVLSWSMMEAMSAGCLVIGSDTPPVREMIDGTNGVLAPMFDIAALAQKMVSALADRESYRPFREAARKTMCERFDAQSICLPEQMAFLENLVGKKIKAKEDQAMLAD